MALPPTSKLKLLDKNGQPLTEAPEWQEGYLELEIPVNSWEDYVLLLNGSPAELFVKRLGGRPRVLAVWPRANAGRYTLHLTGPGVFEASETEVKPAKISTEEFGSLLEDLETALPASIALSLNKGGALAGLKTVSSTNTLEQEVMRLRRALFGSGQPGLLELLPRIARGPHTVLASSEQWTAAGRARRLQPTRLATAMARPHNLDLRGLPERVVEIRAEVTFDTYENRLLKTYVEAVQTKLRRVLAILVQRKSPHLTEVRSWLEFLTGVRQEASFLNAVPSLTSPYVRPTMVLLKQRNYRAVFYGFLNFRRGLSVDLQGQVPEAGLRDVPFLYQTWCSLKAVDALLAAALGLGYVVEHQTLVRLGSSGLSLTMLPGNQNALELRHADADVRAVLGLKKRYGATGNLYSASHVQEPDMALEVSRGAAVEVYLLDPKYKLAGEGGDRPKKEDIDKMHAYRDAIRTSSGALAVRYAAILYPGATIEYIEGLAAISAKPLNKHLDDYLQLLFTQALVLPAPPVNKMQPQASPVQGLFDSLDTNL